MMWDSIRKAIHIHSTGDRRSYPTGTKVETSRVFVVKILGGKLFRGRPGRSSVVRDFLKAGLQGEQTRDLHRQRLLCRVACGGLEAWIT